MGAEPYLYTVPYEQNIQAALDKLRAEVFVSGDFRGAEMNPNSPQEAFEMMEEEGTASILDIDRISSRPDFCCAAPFTKDELIDYFGSETPSPAAINDSDLFWDELERGHARYAVAYEDSQPSSIHFVGYSFD